ncbi:GDP-fucose protein O-fucosyltransferase [Medicago truncatula]|uniref:O-fucosyltransferase family protein n=1 Tax=Medicago truncatula TaxID=3880 RepID=G7I9L6_MEDTR|nr:GDP-fucose protein O-fucosyltransferase [Medicago truncatula]
MLIGRRSLIDDHHHLLRCRCNFHALQFVPEYKKLLGCFLRGCAELNLEKSEKSSKKASKYLALHLRFEIDMVAHSLCEFGGGEEERKELEAYREIHFPALALMKNTTKYVSQFFYLN